MVNSNLAGQPLPNERIDWVQCCHGTKGAALAMFIVWGYLIIITTKIQLKMFVLFEVQRFILIVVAVNMLLCICIEFFEFAEIL